MKASTESATFNHTLLDTTLQSEESAVIDIWILEITRYNINVCFPQQYFKIFPSDSGKNNHPKTQNEQSQPQPEMVYNVLNNYLKDF